MSRWDERYMQFGASYGTEPNDFLVLASAYLRPRSRILSIAEGEGRNAMFLARQGHFVTAIDASLQGVRNASLWATRENVDLVAVHADLATYDFGLEDWDAIVSIWCHLPPGLRRHVYRATVPALRAEGLVIIEAYRPAQLGYGTGGPPDRDVLVTLADLEEDLAGLEFLHAVETVREVHEGRLHTGTSAVVQAIARKPRPEGPRAA